MSRLPQLEHALVAAAARGVVPARRRRVLTFARAGAALAAVACAVLALALIARSGDEREAVTPSPPARVSARSLALSAALAAAPAPAPSGKLVPHAQLGAVAAEFERATPSPPGMRDAFDWAATPANPRNMASINTRTDIQFLVEYRAQCLWLRYWLATRSTDAVTVLHDVPRWPSLRPAGDRQLRKNAAAAAAGDAAAIQAQVDVNCKSVGG